MLPLIYLYKALQLNEEFLQTILLCVKLRLQKITIFGKEEITFFLSLICFYCAIRFLMWIIESVDLKEHFVHQNFPIHLTIFFITTSRFSTTVLFWQNATLSNIWIGIAFFAIRNTNKIAWRTLTLFGGVRKGESCF